MLYINLHNLGINYYYTSAGSVVRPARKIHPNASSTSHVIVNEAAEGAVVEQCDVREDEFWDYDKQIDLEGK